MADFLKEINKYVSGTYAIEKNNTCMINEILLLYSFKKL
jgi:hypothetical protein